MTCKSIALKFLALVMMSLVPLLPASVNPAAATVVHDDEHGVKVEYFITDTGRITQCSDTTSPDYTTKKIKIWKATIRLTNNADKRIKPLSRPAASLNVQEDRGSSLDYCHYNTLSNFSNVGYPDQGGLSFGVLPGMAYPINPGGSFSESVYLYIYEDRKPMMASWNFGGYRFLKDRKNTAKKAQPAAPRATAAKTSPASHPNRPAPRRASGPSGSLLLLMDVSGSMGGSKLSAAKRAAMDTIRKALKNKTEIAVLAFEGDCANPLDSSIGFTRDEKRLIAFVKGLSAQGGTPLATALEATNRFMQQHKSAASRTQMILLLADGDDDCGGLDRVLTRLKQNNLLYRHETVGLEVSGAAQRQLQNIARQSGGNYHSATSQNLSKVFSDAVNLMKMLDMIGKFN